MTCAVAALIPGYVRKINTSNAIELPAEVEVRIVALALENGVFGPRRHGCF
jgi:hypothetical protein